MAKSDRFDMLREIFQRSKQQEIVRFSPIISYFHHNGVIIIIIIMNFYSPVSNTRCHSIGHKMRIARVKIRVDSPGRWERA